MHDESGCALLGVSTFVARCHDSESCGVNGLPLTANSVKIVGRFQWLKSLRHKNICRYVDIVRAPRERLIVVLEHHAVSVETLLLRGRQTDAAADIDVRRLAADLTSALRYLHRRHLVVRNITTSSVLRSTDGVYKLSQFGMYHMTDGGCAVCFPIGCVDYMSPEVLAVDACSPHDTSVCGADVWSTGVTLARAALAITHPPSQHHHLVEMKNHGAARHVVSCALRTLDLIENGGEVDVLQQLAAVNNRQQQLQDMNGDVRDFISQCLTVDPSCRPTAHQLANHVLLSSSAGCDVSDVTSHPADDVTCGDSDGQLDMTQPFPLVMDSSIDRFLPNRPPDCSGGVTSYLRCLPLDEVYHLWQLAGGDVHAELVSHGVVKQKPAILTLPTVITAAGESLGEARDWDLLYDAGVVELSLHSLVRRLNAVSASAFFPLLDKDPKRPLLHSQSLCELKETALLPLVIKESDIEYQLHRITLFRRLLLGYPYTRERLVAEARIDIAPLYRGLVWAALLNVGGLLATRYHSIDKATPVPADRQIEVDIPRCHQYSELLSSPAAHATLQRVLKTWVVSHPRYVYWQGLDSLAAPLVALNFNNEPLAFACLSAFIDKYLHDFFLKDNSAVIQEYLTVFSQLVAFHEPLLSQHLHEIGFVPDLYSIPWFLTMFTHVFPLHKIFHIWDVLLLNDSGLALCVGLGILQCLRDRLLQCGFNECILLFSDMPDISIEEVVKEAVRVRERTPDSVLYREHAPISERRASDVMRSQPISLQQLKILRVPRISAADLKERMNSANRPLVLDIRPAEMYRGGSVRGSVSVPAGEDLSSVRLLAPSEERLTVVLAQWHDLPACNQVAESLLGLAQRRVCLLHGGVEAVAQAGLLEAIT